MGSNLGARERSTVRRQAGRERRGVRKPELSPRSARLSGAPRAHGGVATSLVWQLRNAGSNCRPTTALLPQQERLLRLRRWSRQRPLRRLRTRRLHALHHLRAARRAGRSQAPAPNPYPSHLRDYEYKRLGTVSLQAGLDLHTGRVTEIVRDRHASVDFIALLGKLDAEYPVQARIRLLLDNTRRTFQRRRKRT